MLPEFQRMGGASQRGPPKLPHLVAGVHKALGWGTMLSTSATLPKEPLLSPLFPWIWGRDDAGKEASLSLHHPLHHFGRLRAGLFFAKTLKQKILPLLYPGESSASKWLKQILKNGSISFLLYESKYLFLKNKIIGIKMVWEVEVISDSFSFCFSV